VEFYTLDNILAQCPDCQYYMIIGGRSHGKTYASLKYALSNYVKTGERAALIRRYYEDFKGNRSRFLFRALVENGEISTLTGGKWEYVYYHAGGWYLARNELHGKQVQRVTEDFPFMFGFPIVQMEHDKGSRYTGTVTTVIFDEFMSRTGYLPDEFALFTNVISTIKGMRTTVKIFMLGNTVNRYCPYFKQMGLTHVKDMRPGQITVYRFPMDDGRETRVAVEYTNMLRAGEKVSDEYFGFDNPKLKMITSGVWEFALYPHLPVKYRPKDILFTFFIRFDNELFQCEIINLTTDDGIMLDFIYIHRKTTPLKFPQTELIYDTEYNPAHNYRRRLTVPVTNAEKRILKYFRAEKVFYQDNSTGETIRNYLEWSATETQT